MALFFQFSLSFLNKKLIKDTQIHSILAILRDPYTGELRKRESTNALPGWKFVKQYVIRMSGWHQNGGVARSNLYYHGMKNWIIKKVKDHDLDLKGKNRGDFTKEEDDLFLQYRQEYCRALKEIFIVLKDMLED